MSASALSIAITGLNAAQAGLLTTSHNIANSNTAGYSRQSIVQTTQTPEYTGSGFLGQGTRVLTVQRAYSSFLTSQINTSQAATSQLDTYQTEIEQIDNMLSDSTVGMTPAISSFYQGINAVASNPSDISSRQSLLSAGQSLVSRFQDMSQSLQQINDGVNQQIGSEVTTINSMAQQVAALNQSILVAEANGGGTQQDNDLRDQRDELVTELNQHIATTVVPQSDGSYSLFFGNGQPLVVGNSTYSLTATASTTDPTKTTIGLQSPNGTTSTLPESLVTGGALGGLLSFRSQTLAQAQNTLGLMAIGLSSSINAQSQLGQDLTGAMGSNFFNVPSPVVTPSTTNGGGGTISVSIANVSNMQASDYSLQYTSGGYTLRRLSDNTTLFSNATLPQTVDGLTITATGTPTVGDTFSVQPTYYAANSLSMAITDPRSIAAGSPVTTNATTSNTGSATISAGSLLASFSTPGSSPNVPSYSMSYDLANKALVVSHSPSAAGDMPNGTVVAVTVNGTTTNYTIDNTATPPTEIPYTSGMSMTITPPPVAPATTSGSIQVSFTGTPAQGDTFTISQSAANSNDSRNAVALGQVQTQKTLLGGTATVDTTYSQMVSQIGNTANQIQVDYTSQSSLLSQVQSTQQSLSGVNLDEEAANLLRYQQAYQASAKIISISSQLFSLLTSLGQ